MSDISQRECRIGRNGCSEVLEVIEICGYIAIGTAVRRKRSRNP